MWTLPASAFSPFSPANRERALRLVVPGYADSLSPAHWLIFAARIINALALNSAFPFLASYFAKDRGLPSVVIGSIFMGQGIVGSLSQLLGGDFADRFGRRVTIVTSLAVRSVVVLALGLLILWRAPVPVIVAMMMANSLLFGLFQPSLDALVVDITPPERRIAAFAHQRVAINIGWAAGPMLGGLMAHGALAWLFVGASPFVLLGTFVFSRLPDPPRQGVKRENPFSALRETLRDRALRIHLFGSLLLFMLAGQLVVTLSVEAAPRLQLDSHHLGLLWSLNGVLVVLLQMPIARLVGRIGARRALTWSALAYAVAYAAVGWSATYTHIVICMIGITAAELLNTPSQQAGISERATPATTGRILGLLGLTMTLGRSLGPVVGGAVHDAYLHQPIAMWALLGSIGVIAALVYAHPELRQPPPAGATSEGEKA